MERKFGPTEQVLWPISVFSGIIMCKVVTRFGGKKKMQPCAIGGILSSLTKGKEKCHITYAPERVYEVTCRLSMVYFKGYNNLSKLQKIEWNNRGFSTFHAFVAAAVSFYLLVISDLFKSDAEEEFIVNRKSLLSDAMFGISLGYFLSDMAMILWLFPSLGGKEYVLHHGLSIYAIFLALVSGKAHIYILMVLLTEATTPFVNLRWYLDLAGQKSSNLYVYNGVALFFGWLVARILLFIYFFTHMYLHFDEVKTMFTLGLYSLLTVPPMLAVMNVVWFRKIFKGMMKTLSKRRHTS